MPLALRHQYTLALMAAAVLLVVYGVLAYFFLPLVWKRFEHQRALAGFSMVTRTADGIPGDAINVGLDRKIGDWSVDVRHEMKPSWSEPRALHRDVGQVIGDELANLGVAFDAGNDFQVDLRL